MGAIGGAACAIGHTCGANLVESRQVSTQVALALRSGVFRFILEAA